MPHKNNRKETTKSKGEGFKVGFGKYRDKSLNWVAQNDIEFFTQIHTLYYPKYSDSKKRAYNTLKRKYITNSNASTHTKYEAHVGQVIAFLKEKKKSEFITNYLKDLKLSPAIITHIMSSANFQIRKEFELEKNFLLDIHLLRYEEIFFENVDVNLDHVSPTYRKAILCEHKITALETLFQKEKLLGVHTKSFKLQFEKHSVVHKNTNLDFDLTKLTAVERLEVLTLLNKAKPIQKLNQPAAQENPFAIDEAVSVPQQEESEAPIKGAKQTFKKEDEERELQQTQGKTLAEVQQSLDNTLKDQIKKLFDKKKK